MYGLRKVKNVVPLLMIAVKVALNNKFMIVTVNHVLTCNLSFF